MVQTDLFKPKKLSPQCQVLLNAFMSNREHTIWNWQIRFLTPPILNHTGRISDLRAAGYEINEVKKEGGSRLYRLEGKR